jgi:hypothetical protein
LVLCFFAAPAHGVIFLWVDLEFDFFDRPIIDPNAATPNQIVQLLIERGCQYAARNNDGFTASDYAYSLVILFAAVITRVDAV